MLKIFASCKQGSCFKGGLKHLFCIMKRFFFFFPVLVGLNTVLPLYTAVLWIGNCTSINTLGTSVNVLLCNLNILFPVSFSHICITKYYPKTTFCCYCVILICLPLILTFQADRELTHELLCFAVSFVLLLNLKNVKAVKGVQFYESLLLW